MFKKLVFSLTLAFVASGCARRADNAPSPLSAHGCVQGEACNYKIGNLSVPDYYAKFMYQTEGNCTQIDNVRFRQLVSEEIATGVNTQGDVESAVMTLALEADGTYTGNIASGVDTQDESGKSIRNVTSQKALNGTWSLNQSRIVLSNLGVGQAQTQPQGEGIGFTLDVSDAGLNTKATFLTLQSTAMSKDGETPQAYCQKVMDAEKKLVGGAHAG